MEWIYEMLTEIALSVLGIVLSAVAAKLGQVFGAIWKEKAKDENVLHVTAVCVSAVEMMYRELGGEEKLSLAMDYAEKMLKEKGITLSSDQIRLYLEAALAQWKGAFDKA